MRCVIFPMLMIASPALADDPVERIRSVEVGSDGACPTAGPGEVVVCHPADDPYRIPKQLRGDAEPAAANQSWVNRAATMDEVGRVAGGLPNTCSAVGTGGQTGCLSSMLRAWSAERRQAARGAESMP